LGCYDTNTMCIQNTGDLYDKVKYIGMYMIKKMNSVTIQEIPNFLQFFNNSSQSC